MTAWSISLAAALSGVILITRALSSLRQQQQRVDAEVLAELEQKDPRPAVGAVPYLYEQAVQKKNAAATRERQRTKLAAKITPRAASKPSSVSPFRRSGAA